ncbi:MAG: hypothetical protein DRN27_10245, partial [Thermoplasmata archaeon]
SISFENSDCIAVSKMKRKKSILFLDNDLKYSQKNNIVQTLENQVKHLANHIIVPQISKEKFCNHFKNKDILTYNGYKEDIYLADFTSDPKFKEKIPYERFIVIRPEALGSFYVEKNLSIIPELFSLFEKNNTNIIYLPREKNEAIFAKNHDVFIPKSPLNGLDLSYYADAVLTGSGTMAREAARMGKKAVSFFPNTQFLSVDKQLIQEKKIFHSRDPNEICEYIITNPNKFNQIDFTQSKKVKNEVLTILDTILKNMDL